MKTLTLQICGTGSGVGKSIAVCALCRIFLRDGYRVSPFKAQNMALNSFVTKEGGEMGRAQVAQAQACRIEPHTDMNPVLIKPTADKNAQVILQGKPVGNMSVKEFIKFKGRAIKNVIESFNRIKEENEVIVIEGAGSVAEINLKRHDIVNLKMAKIADAPVILLGDIDKGGVFASLVGTLELLDKDERKRIKGFIINKFRGDKTLLKDAITFLEKKTKKPVLGVIPYFTDIRIPAEDSLDLEKSIEYRVRSIEGSGLIQIAVIKLPHISNFTDFDSLETETDIKLTYINNKSELNSRDVVIIPGTKNTIADLLWLKRTGLADKILSTIDYQPKGNGGTILIGICGGYQMLGKEIHDASHLESNIKRIRGLGVLPIITKFKKEKVLAQVKAKEILSGLDVSGYEIHHGRTKHLNGCQPVFRIIDNYGRQTERYDGTISENKQIWGTYIHGVFDAPDFRRNLLNRIRLNKKLPALPQKKAFDNNADKEFNKLAELFRRNINMKLLYKILRHDL